VLLPPWDTKPVAAQEDVLSQPSRQKRQPPELRPITTNAARPGPASTCSHTGHRCHFKHHSSRTFGANSKKPGQVLPRGRYRRVGSGEIGGQRDVRPGQWRTRSELCIVAPVGERAGAEGGTGEVTLVLV